MHGFDRARVNPFGGRGRMRLDAEAAVAG